MKPLDSYCVTLPAWCGQFAAGLPERVPEMDARIELAIELSRRNVAEGTGGPFGAVVSRVSDGGLVALGVNRVEPACCSSAHAEIVAISLAQARLGTWTLAGTDGGPMELATSCEPCAMCLGAIPWSGVARLVCGATRDDAEAIGFDEGDRPADWVAALGRRGIEVVTGCHSDRARQVLVEYRERGGPIY